jgi:CRP-like cAMP-binding protein
MDSCGIGALAETAAPRTGEGHAAEAVAAPLAALCAVCPVRRLPPFRAFEPADLALAQKSVVARRRFGAEADLLRADDIGGGFYTLWDGWAYRYREVAPGDGGPPLWRIVDILLPGDMFGLEAALTGRVGSPVRALTPVTVCVHAPRGLATALNDRPNLAGALIETGLRDQERADARLAAANQVGGGQRAAHLVLELRDRLSGRGMAPGLAADGSGRMPFPMQRRHLAAALGMSGTHVARSFAELDAGGLARVEGQELVILDAVKLAALCGYVPVAEAAGRRALI